MIAVHTVTISHTTMMLPFALLSLSFPDLFVYSHDDAIVQAVTTTYSP